MVEIFRGQTGNSVLTMHDAEGDVTDKYQHGSVVYASDDEAVMTITADLVDEKHAHVEAVGNGGPVRLRCSFDGDPDDPDVRHIELQSADEYTVVEPPPGEAVSATFEVTWVPAEA